MLVLGKAELASNLAGEKADKSGNELQKKKKGAMIISDHGMKKLEIPPTHAEQRGIPSSPGPEICGSVLCLSLQFKPGNKHTIGC